MSSLFESISEKNKNAYMKTAAEVSRQAEDTVVRELGEEALQTAVTLLELDARAPTIPDAASDFVRQNDISASFNQEVQHPDTIDMGIADDATDWLKNNFTANAYSLQGDRAAQKFNTPPSPATNSLEK